MTSEHRPDGDPLHLAELELAAWEGFLRAHSTVTGKLDAELERLGLSLASYGVLVKLARAPRRRMRMLELADAVLFSPSGLSRLVERLEREGLVARVRSADDGRGAYATLTERGRQLLRKATRTHLAGVREYFLAELTDKEQRELADIWRRMLTSRDADERGATKRRA